MVSSGKREEMTMEKRKKMVGDGWFGIVEVSVSCFGLLVVYVESFERVPECNTRLKFPSKHSNMTAFLDVCRLHLSCQ